MFGLDDAIAGLGGGSLLLALTVAFLLGLRHATDPDHLTAVSTLVLLDDDGRGWRRASGLGMSWGLGHATTLLLLGLPFVLLGHALPAWAHTAAELAVAAVIVALAGRLLLRWHRGYLHMHPHSHGDARHVHPHVHEHAHDDAHPAEHRHEHAHPETLGRSPRAAYGIGLVHGVGGSAGVGILLVSGLSGGTAVVALVLFALATAVSMALASSAFSAALASGPLLRRLERLVPGFGTVSLAFGVWYALGALGAAPYVF